MLYADSVILLKETQATTEELSLNQKSDNPINFEELKESLILELEEQHDERVAEVIINMTEEYELRIEELQKDFKLEKSEIHNKLNEISQHLESECANKEKLKNELMYAKERLNLMQQELADNGKKISEVEQRFESEINKKEEIIQRHFSEIALLEQSKYSTRQQH